MQHTKKILGLLILLCLVFVPMLVFAQAGPNPGPAPGPNPGPSTPTGGDTPGLTNPLKAKTVSAFLGDVLEVVRDIGFIVAIFFIVYAGFLFVTARGNDEKLQRAKKAFLWAIVGTAVLLGAHLFATIIQGTVEDIEARNEYHIVRGVTAPLQDTNHFV